MYVKYKLETVVVVISCCYKYKGVYLSGLGVLKIVRSCVFNSIKAVKTCVRLPGGNRIISHVSDCKVLKQSATIVELISDSHVSLYPWHLCRRVYSFRFSVRPFVCSFVGSFLRS